MTHDDDAWLRVIVRGPAGPASPRTSATCSATRVVDVQRRQPGHHRRPAAGATITIARRRSCSTSTSPTEGVDDDRVRALFAELLDAEHDGGAAMRPLRLEMEGFGAFREPTDVDFTDIDLVALVGATGSGKSTIIDAITFALYGSVARYDDNRLVAPVINQTSTQARVRLDFELGGRHVHRGAGRAAHRQGRDDEGGPARARRRGPRRRRQGG